MCREGLGGSLEGAVLPMAVGRGDPTQAPAPLCPPGSVLPHSCSWGPRFPPFPGLGVLWGSPLRSGALQPTPASKSLSASGADVQARLRVRTGQALFTYGRWGSAAFKSLGTGRGFPWPQTRSGGQGQSPDLQAETEGQAELGHEALQKVTRPDRAAVPARGTTVCEGWHLRVCTCVYVSVCL